MSARRRHRKQTTSRPRPETRPEACSRVTPRGPHAPRRAFHRRGRSLLSRPRRSFVLIRLLGWLCIVAGCIVTYGALIAAASLGALLGGLGVALSVAMIALGLAAIGVGLEDG